MLQESPKVRLCVADVIGHPWMQGPIATEDEIRVEFANRDRLVKKEAEADAAKKQAEK